MDILDLVQKAISGQRLALTKIFTQLENQTSDGQTAMNALFPHTGRAYLIGVTGAPGSGKSSLVNKLALEIRRQHPDQKVGIVAVDPSSPFSGGAVLGDRIRMKELSGDKNVFIRSMASRGSLGGLAAACANIVQAFDAAGYQTILIETVGAGQAEVDIAKLAHTTLVVEAPGMGDDIQAIKSGIMEIADILVVNKADKPGADNTAMILQNMIEMGREQLDWIPPVKKVVSTEGIGIVELWEAVEEHRNYLESHQLRRAIDQRRLEFELLDTIKDRLFSVWKTQLDQQLFDRVFELLIKREISPGEAVVQLMEEYNDLR